MIMAKMNLWINVTEVKVKVGKMLNEYIAEESILEL